MEMSLFIATITMAFLGSWHCGVMCGPLSCNFRKPKTFFSYHLGRLVSYSILSALLFWGVHYFLDADSRPLKVVTSVFCGLILILFGIGQLQRLPGQQRFQFKIFKFQHQLLNRFKNPMGRFPVLLGLLTGLFPCGWLYSFLALSSQMKTIQHAQLIVFIFWFCSLPAFLVFTGFMSQLIKSAPISYQRISAAVMILAGLLSIFGHWTDLMFLI